ncbi:CsbD family protein [Heyndrickxia acidiproducens]|uniref:CsbD family protein n=1 Tax=Heyndrickxia acidiproducens TaxID=1121084 RepID=UPI00035F2C0E|nr:CsbD family protein [Heyndrickxia acidiproducens]
MDKDSMKDKLKGKFNQLKGDAKEALANATDDAGKKTEAKADKAKGKTQESIGDAKDRMAHQNK